MRFPSFEITGGELFISGEWWTVLVHPCRSRDGRFSEHGRLLKWFGTSFERRVVRKMHEGRPAELHQSMRKVWMPYLMVMIGRNERLVVCKKAS